jgi:arylformamidase
MRYYDVTRHLENNMLVYPGDIEPTFHQKDHGKYLISDLHLSSHSGTHIDAPTHYLKTGNTIDCIPLESLIGSCRVIEVGGSSALISHEQIAGKIVGEKRIILRTSFSGNNVFSENYPSLSLEAAEYLISCGVVCVGIDSPSIEAYDCDGEVHRHLLNNNCIIIELLELTGVTEGIYEMIALPLKLTGLDGSPARVILKDSRGCE